MRVLLPVGAIQIVQQHVSTRNTVLYGCTTTPAYDFTEINNTSSSKPFRGSDTISVLGKIPDLKAYNLAPFRTHISIEDLLGFCSGLRLDT